jgi:hypothetical protein
MIGKILVDINKNHFYEAHLEKYLELGPVPRYHGFIPIGLL